MNLINTKNYPVHIGHIWPALNELLAERNYSDICVIADANTERHCLPFFKSSVSHSFKTLKIPVGEIYKTLNTCQQIWKFLLDHNFDRDSLVINLGGGVIGDMGGFCASTFKRGIDFIQIPTTLLSQVDASVGGKLGIDFSYVKNAIGVFNDPQAVFIYPPFLDTLPAKELRSGFAEMIKHSLIADKAHWNQLKSITKLNARSLMQLIPVSLQIKKAIVEADPFEKNIRKLLNFGHTIGHAVESLALQEKQKLTHGEAVAIGMLCEAWISRETCDFPEEEFQEISNFIRQLYPHFPIHESTEALIALMQKDKKNRGKEINFSMLKGIGNALINQQCDQSLIRASLDYYRSINKMNA